MANSNETTIVAPRLNLNGSNKKALMSDYLLCVEALRTAVERLNAIAPHRRDYQTAPYGTFLTATRQHKRRVSALIEVMGEVGSIAEKVYDQPWTDR